MVDAIILIVGTGFVILAAALPWHRFLAVVGVAMVMAIPVAVGHARAAQDLAPLAAEFVRVVERERPEVTVVYTFDGREARGLSYAGALDRLVAERDRYLAANRYFGIGAWRVVDRSPSLRMIYVRRLAALPAMTVLAVLVGVPVRRYCRRRRILAK